MTNVFDVANFIIEKIGSLTTMKLQKLVYYSQAWSLAWDDLPLFDEEFEAWANGPVCKSLFDLHRGKYLVDTDLFKGKLTETKFTQEQIETINTVIEYYGDKAPNWLSDLTHSELPWIEARGDCKEGSYCDSIIDKETMRQYYSGL